MTLDSHRLAFPPDGDMISSSPLAFRSIWYVRFCCEKRSNSSSVIGTAERTITGNVNAANASPGTVIRSAIAAMASF
jgi:hypothetical protein